MNAPRAATPEDDKMPAPFGPRTHTRSCPQLSPASEERCTCALEWRIRACDEWTHREAWTKRALEAEAALAARAAPPEPDAGETAELVKRLRGKQLLQAVDAYGGGRTLASGPDPDANAAADMLESLAAALAALHPSGATKPEE